MLYFCPNMAKTLFFIEALALAALSLLFPMIASQTAAAFIAPLGASLLLPLLCALAIWPARSVYRALRGVFASPLAPSEAEESARILESLASFSRVAAVLGILFFLVVVLDHLPSIGSPRIWTYLGVYLSLYALVNAELWQVLAAVARGGSEAEAATHSGEAPSDATPGALSAQAAFAAVYGLSPREWETALHIAGGESYKETACDLGISIRTVKAHMGRVYEKTGAASNVGLVLKMRAEGALLQKSNGAETPQWRYSAASTGKKEVD